MGELIRVLREKAKLSQDELAAKSGLSRVTISKIECGKVEFVSTKTIAAIAEALEVPVSIFFT